MSQEEDGGKPAKVFDITRRVNFKDNTTALAEALVHTLTERNATTEEYLAALLLAVRAVKKLALEGGMPEEDLLEVARAALTRSARYRME